MLESSLLKAISVRLEGMIKAFTAFTWQRSLVQSHHSYPQLSQPRHHASAKAYLTNPFTLHATLFSRTASLKAAQKEGPPCAGPPGLHNLAAFVPELAGGPRRREALNRIFALHTPPHPD